MIGATVIEQRPLRPDTTRRKHSLMGARQHHCVHHAVISRQVDLTVNILHRNEEQIKFIYGCARELSALKEERRS